MRLNQISVKIQRFGEQASNGKEETLCFYADSDNIYEALASINKNILLMVSDKDPAASSNYFRVDDEVRKKFPYINTDLFIDGGNKQE